MPNHTSRGSGWVAEQHGLGDLKMIKKVGAVDISKKKPEKMKGG